MSHKFDELLNDLQGTQERVLGNAHDKDVSVAGAIYSHWCLKWHVFPECPQYKLAEYTMVAEAGMLADEIVPQERRQTISQMKLWIRDAFGFVLAVSATVFEAKKEAKLDETDEDTHDELEGFTQPELHRVVVAYRAAHPERSVGQLARRTLRAMVHAQSMSTNPWKLVPSNIVNFLWPE